MRPIACPLVCIFLVGNAAVRADVVELGAVADAFVSAAHPANNYGGGGSLAVAAPGLANGEFQTVFRFDTASAAAAFNAAFGPGQWAIQSITFKLNSTPPANPLFNPAAAGQFAIMWMQRDDWVEGPGTPNMPGATGITFNDLPGFVGPGDESLGVFNFDGGTSGFTIRALLLPSGFVGDVKAGGLVSMRLAPQGTTIAMLVNSHSFQTETNRPVLSITAGPVGPTCYANCDHSSGSPVLTGNDFQCFLNRYVAGESYANCDGSTGSPTLTGNDFQCFLNAYVAGCS